MEKTKIYHILEIKTKRVLVSSLDEDALTKIWLDKYSKGTDFIYSYDGEPIRKEMPNGLTVGEKFIPESDLMKMSKDNITDIILSVTRTEPTEGCETSIKILKNVYKPDKDV